MAAAQAFMASEALLRCPQHRAVPPAATAAAACRRPCAPPAPWRPLPRRSPSPVASSTGFHQSLLTATERTGEPAQPLPAMAVREAEADGELEAAAWLRALSFYRYPEERKFAAQVGNNLGIVCRMQRERHAAPLGMSLDSHTRHRSCWLWCSPHQARCSCQPFPVQVHRTMVAEEEVKALKAARMARRLGDDAASGERTTCLVALCPAAALQAADGQPLDEQLIVQGGSSSGSSAATLAAGGMRERAAASALAAAEAAGEPLAVVGTLDLYAARAMRGEVLIGDSRNAAYLANVCTAPQARRRGVGNALLAAARELAVAWGERRRPPWALCPGLVGASCSMEERPLWN